MLFLSCCGVAGPCAGKGCLPNLRTGWGCRRPVAVFRQGLQGCTRPQWQPSSGQAPPDHVVSV